MLAHLTASTPWRSSWLPTWRPHSRFTFGIRIDCLLIDVGYVPDNAIEHLSNLARHVRRAKWFANERGPVIDHAIVDECVVGVARHVEDLDCGTHSRKLLRERVPQSRSR